jgi:hypothetical protein
VLIFGVDFGIMDGLYRDFVERKSKKHRAFTRWTAFDDKIVAKMGHPIQIRSQPEECCLRLLSYLFAVGGYAQRISFSIAIAARVQGGSQYTST